MIPEINVPGWTGQKGRWRASDAAILAPSGQKFMECLWEVFWISLHGGNARKRFLKAGTLPQWTCLQDEYQWRGSSFAALKGRVTSDFWKYQPSTAKSIAAFLEKNPLWCHHQSKISLDWQKNLRKNFPSLSFWSRNRGNLSEPDIFIGGQRLVPTGTAYGVEWCVSFEDRVWRDNVIQGNFISEVLPPQVESDAMVLCGDDLPAWQTRIITQIY